MLYVLNDVFVEQNISLEFLVKSLFNPFCLITTKPKANIFQLETNRINTLKIFLGDGLIKML